jgi:predicted translin family RNA/ssDNA-binding protein
MTSSIDRRRSEIARLKREIAYYCGVSVRTTSRGRIQRAHEVIRQCERQLRERTAAATREGGGDE